MPRNAVITGLGFVTSIGIDRGEVVARLRSGTSGVARYDFCGNPQHPVQVAAPVKGFQVEGPSWRDWQWPARYQIPRETIRGLAPHGVYFLVVESKRNADPRVAHGVRPAR